MISLPVANTILIAIQDQIQNAFKKASNENVIVQMVLQV